MYGNLSKHSFTVFFYPWISMMSQREGIFNMAICEEQPIREKLAKWAGSWFQTEDQTLGLFWTVNHAKPANDSVRCWTIITIKSSDVHLSDAVIGSSVRSSVTERAQLTSRPGLRHRFMSQHLKLMRYLKLFKFTFMCWCSSLPKFMQTDVSKDDKLRPIWAENSIKPANCRRLPLNEWIKELHRVLCSGLFHLTKYLLQSSLLQRVH